MKALIRILFILLPFLWSILALAQPDQSRDCSSTCFSTEVISAEKLSGTCTAFEWRVSWSGDCAHALSHFTVEIPCGEISGLWNSENWAQEIGTDATTGISGFKIDDIQDFGESSLKEFTVKFVLCSTSEACAATLQCWQPRVAYKASSCVNFQSIELPCQQLKASLEKSDVSCFGAGDGSLTVVVEEATAPVTYLWSNGSVASSINGLAPGTYSVQVKDASGSELVLEGVIDQPDAVTLSGEITNASCSGIDDGGIDLSASGGNNLTYEWSNGATTEDLANIPAGTYTVTATGEGCSVQKTFVVAGNSTVTVDASLTQPLCASSDGKIDISVSGGMAPYTFQWSTGAVTEDIDNLVAGLYDVRVTDSRGCTTTEYVVLMAQNPVNLSFETTKSACTQSTGSIDLTVSGGSEPYTYSWSTGDDVEDLAGLPAGAYSVTVTDINGCSKTGHVSVFENTFSVTGSVSNVSCTGAADGSIVLDEPDGGEGPYTYLWSTGDVSEAVDGLGSGVYSVEVTDMAGCTQTSYFLVSAPVAITASAFVSNTNCGGEGAYSVDLVVTGGSGTYSFQWQDGAATEDRELLSTGSYTVVISDSKGCSLEKTVTVEAVETWSCAITPPAASPSCQSTGNVLETAVAGAEHYTWTVESSDGSWVITEGSSAASVTYSAGNEGSSATFTLAIEKQGCQQTCSYTVSACVGSGDDGSSGGDDGNDDDDGGDNGNDDGTGTESCEECFSSSIRMVDNTGSCAIYEVVVNSDGRCRNELSHWSIDVPCGTIGEAWNSNGWPMETGSDPTTGLVGLKVDNIVNFGTAESSFVVRFSVCYDATCDASQWAPVVGYKAGQCVGFESLQVPEAQVAGMTLTVYPNPFREKIYFEWVAETDDYGTLEVLDQFGHPVAQVFSGTVKRASVYKAEWSGLVVNTGIYYYRFITAGKTYYGKLFRN